MIPFRQPHTAGDEPAYQRRVDLTSMMKLHVIFSACRNNRYGVQILALASVATCISQLQMRCEVNINAFDRHRWNTVLLNGIP